MRDHIIERGYLTEEQAADLLGWHVNTLRQYRYRGKPTPKFGKYRGTVFYSREDVEQFIKEQIECSLGKND